jgi:hypothetical protein
MLSDRTTVLSPCSEMKLAEMALIQAVRVIAGQAEVLASEMEIGALASLSGPEALRLFAGVVQRLHAFDVCPPAGHA